MAAPEIEPQAFVYRSGTSVVVDGKPAEIVGYLVVVNLIQSDGSVRPAIKPIGLVTLPPMHAEAAALHVLPMKRAEGA